MVKDLPVPLVGLWVDLTAQLDIWERRKCSCPGEGQDPNRTVNVKDVEGEEKEHRSKKE
jgi:hypothetical protein